MDFGPIPFSFSMSKLPDGLHHIRKVRQKMA